jgi:hypothetical protein
MPNLFHHSTRSHLSWVGQSNGHLLLLVGTPRLTRGPHLPGARCATSPPPLSRTDVAPRQNRGGRCVHALASCPPSLPSGPASAPTAPAVGPCPAPRGTPALCCTCNAPTSTRVPRAASLALDPPVGRSGLGLVQVPPATPASRA